MPNKESFIPVDWLRKGDKDLKASKILLNEDECELAAFRFLCEKVTEYYIEERYPFIASKLRKEEVEDSLKNATEFIHRLRDEIE